MLYFEGAPAAIVPDNLKAAVTRSDRNEPVINDDFAAFAEHYGCAACPARVRHPKDKALVENAVKLLCRSVYPDMEGMTFSGPDGLNAAFHVSLHDFNEKMMAGREASRKEMFLRGEKNCCAEQKLQYGYQALREVPEPGEDADFLPNEDGRAQPDMTSPIPLIHKNIRGREYYRKDKQEL